MLPMSHANGDKKVDALCLHISSYLFVTIHRAKPVTEMQRQRNRGAWRGTLHLTIYIPLAFKTLAFTI